MTKNFFVYLAVSAIVTYLIRMLPLVMVKEKIQNKFILSFLYYVPYAVLTVMTVPSMFISTGYVLSACIGFIISLILAYRGKSLVTVAAFACLGVFLTETVINFI